MMTRIPKKQLDSTLQVQPAEGAFVDGDKTKLDGIEALADVTDTANVTSAGALMDSELTDIASVKALNQGVATTDSPTFNLPVLTGGLSLTGVTGSNITQISGATAQWSSFGNKLYFTNASFGANAGVNFGINISDGAASETRFIIDRVSNSGAYSTNLFKIQTNTAVATFYGNVTPNADSSLTLGSSSLYWSNTYTDRLYLNSTAYLDGGTAGTVALTGILDIPVTSSSTGQIYQDSARIFHTYTRSDGFRKNVFIGKNAGNFTMSTTGATNLGTGNIGIGYVALSSLTSGYYNIALGTNSGDAVTTGNSNFFAGHQAGTTVTTGSGNFLLGRDSGIALTTGSENVAIGGYSLNSAISVSGNTVVGANSGGFTGANNTAIGYYAGNSATGAGNVFIGHQAGRYETGDNKFIVNNVLQSTEANDRAYSLLYGTFSGTAASLTGQQLTINGDVNTPGTIELTTTGNGIVMKSPDGTRYRVTVANGGTIAVAAA